MKKQLFLGLGLLLIGGIVKAQNPVNFSRGQAKPGAATTNVQQVQKAAKAPVFKFAEKDNTHDFGTIPEGPKATYAFTFTNTGNAPLIITNAQASCGCTSPEFPKEPILPGKKAKISVTYTSQGHPGPFNKSVYLTSNATGEAKYELFIKGNVTPAAK